MLQDIEYKTEMISIPNFKPIVAQFFKTEGEPEENPNTVFALLASETKILFTVAVAMSRDGGSTEILNPNIKLVEGHSHSALSEEDAVKFLQDAIIHAIDFSKNVNFPKEEHRMASVILQRGNF